MKNSFHAALYIMLSLIVPILLPARDYYIIYDESCMDRLEYGYGFTPENQNYIKYHIKIQPTEVLELEVGTEADAPTQNYLRSSAVSCGSEILNRSLLDKVRGGQDQVFMVQPKGNQYKISKVNMASYWKRDDRGLVYDSWQFNIDYFGNLDPGEVLTNDPSKGIKVTYEGTTPYKCTNAFLFRMTFLSGSSSYRDVYLIPGLGVAEERPSSGSPDDIYKLRSVNNLPFDSYLQRLCYSGISTLAGNQQSGMTSRPVATAPQPQQASAYHEVEKGETLYAISRKYDVSVEQLRQWNGLGNSSLLQVGDRLRVTAPEGSTRTELATDIPIPDAGRFAFNDRGSSLTDRGSTAGTTLLRGDSDSRFAWKTTTGWHTVQSGETVALLALKYGYTEARFRDINNLGPNEVVKVGQRLKTTDCPSTNGGVERGYSPGNNTTSRTQTTYAPWTLPAPYNNQSATGSGTDELRERSGTSAIPGTSTGRETAPYTLPSSSFEPYALNTPDFSYQPSGQEGMPRSYDTQSYYTRGAAGMELGEPSLPQTSQYQGELVPQQSTYSFGTPIPKSGSITVRGQNSFSPYDRPDLYRSTPQSYNTSDRSSTQRVYVVREGDTVERIAQRFNTTAERIRQLNDMEPNEILIPYQRLYIE